MKLLNADDNLDKNATLFNKNLQDDKVDIRKKWLTAFQGSRGLSHHSTTWNVDGLNCRVRDETGCGPAALAVNPKGGNWELYLSVISVLNVFVAHPKLHENPSIDYGHENECHPQ